MYYTHIFLQVPLGIILKNENKNSEMVEIMTEMHRYCPRKEHTAKYIIVDTGEIIELPDDLLDPIIVIGDQLTVARIRSAKKAKVNSVDPSLRLDGLVAVAADWHTKENLIEVCMHFQLNTYSSISLC